MTDSNKIICPNCSHEFEITDVLARKIKAEYEVEAQKLRKELEKQKEAFKSELEQLEKSKRDLEKKENEFKQKLDEQVNTELESRMVEIRKQISEDTKQKLEKQNALEKEALQKELEEKETELQTIKKQELELLKKEREFEKKQQEFELRLERARSDIRKEVQEEAEQNFNEKHKMKMIEKEDLIRSLRDQISELQRRSEVGSQEAQGEALERDLLENLQSKFPFDEFVEVKKGEQGHDITQIVKNRMNKVLGKIIWEAKNTKNFNNAWIDKLKIDLQRENADYAMLVTFAMPKDVDHFDLIDEIWVTNYKSALDLCTAIRSSLIKLNSVKATEEHRENLKDALYTYMTSDEFKRRITRIYDDFNKIRDEFEKEKRAMQLNWKRREKSIDNILTNVVSFAGDLTGYLANEPNKPLLEGLSIESLSDSSDDEED